MSSDEPAESTRRTLIDKPGEGVETDEGVDPDEGAELVGAFIDERFELRHVIAIGGMGHVYEAKDHLSGERVAFKTLKPQLAESGISRTRFRREAQMPHRVASPHVVEVLAIGELPDGRPYYAMELLHGRELREILESGAMKPERAVLVALQIATALEATHATGVVHRDLKPDNILLDEGPAGDRVKLVDFGLSKALDGSQDMTGAGEVLGTPHYMAPEQVRGDAVDARTDIYSFGVVLYEMFTGHIPFDGDAPLDVMLAHVEKPVPLPSTLQPPVKLPVLLEWIAMCCLYKEPERRFQSTSELRQELENAARLYHVL